MKTSMITGISHKIILQLATVALLASAGSGTAATITLNHYSEMRYDAYNWDGTPKAGASFKRPPGEAGGGKIDLAKYRRK